MTDKTFTLKTGQKIPALGFGTWQAPPGETKNAVSTALKSGYRLVDAAYCYGNEDEVGQGLKEAFDSGVKREDVFVMTKVWATYNTRVQEGLDKSLKSLGLDYVDMFLVHWPILINPNGNDDRFPTNEKGERDLILGWNHVDAWKQMEALMSTGKTKAIGVSNYSKLYMEQLLKEAKIVPAVNQIENHPNLRQQDAVDLCREKGIHIVAYSPLGSTGGPVMKAEPVVQLAQKKGVSPAVILLSYHVARGSTVLAKSVTESRIKANTEILDLDADDMKALEDHAAELEKNNKTERHVFPPFNLKINLGFPDKQHIFQ